MIQLDTHDTVQIIVTVLGSGFLVGLIEFAKFWITRSDNKIEKKEGLKKDIEDLRNEMNDKFSELRVEVKQIADTRLDIGKGWHEANGKSISELAKVVNTLSSYRERNSEMDKVVGEALMGLGHDRLVAITNQIGKRKAVTLKEKATLEALYKPYEKLGGNGDGKTGYEYCMSLPVITDLEADKLDDKIKRKELGIDKEE